MPVHKQTLPFKFVQFLPTNTPVDTYKVHQSQIYNAISIFKKKKIIVQTIGLNDYRGCNVSVSLASKMETRRVDNRVVP